MFALFSSKKSNNKGSIVTKGAGKVFNSLFHTDRGKIIVSIILGLGLASIFRKYCDGKNCYHFIGPEHNNLRNEIFSHDSNKNKCYTLNEKNVKCDNNKKILEFA